MEAPSAPDQLEAPIPAKPPVLPEVLALAAAADLENDSIKRQQQLHAAVRLLADATAAEAKELCLSTSDAFLQEHAIRRWAELEPRAALDHLLGLDAQQRRVIQGNFIAGQGLNCCTTRRSAALRGEEFSASVACSRPFFAQR